MNKRIIYLDYIRVLACIFVIGIHVCGGFSDIQGPSKILSYLINQILWVGLTAFYMMSGVSVLRKDYESISDFYIKRLIAILIPLIIYSVGYYYVNSDMFELSSMGGVTTQTVLEIIKQLPIAICSVFKGQQYFHLYYVYNLVGLYLAFPFIKVMLDNLSIKKQKALFILIIAYTFANVSLRFFNINLNLQEFIFFSYMKYPILGYLITTDWFRPYLKRIIYVGVFAMLIQVLETYLGTSSDYIEDLGTLQMLKTIGFYSLFIYNKEKFESFKINSVITFLSKNTYSIFLIHGFVLRHAYKVYDYRIVDGMSNIAIYLNDFIGTILVFIISLLLALIIDNIITKPIQKGFRKIQLKF